MTMQLATYLFFTDACEAALAAYQAAGLGEITELRRHGEAAGPALRGRILHARFEGPGVLFYASDNDDAEPMRGSAQLLTLDDRAEAERLFTRFAAGGRITTPLGVQPWSDFYGKLTDRFGVQWMFDCPLLPGEPDRECGRAAG